MTEWSDLVKKTFTAGKQKNPDYKLKNAMKDAAKVYHGGNKKVDGGNKKEMAGGNKHEMAGGENKKEMVGGVEDDEEPRNYGGKSKRRTRRHKKSHKKKHRKSSKHH
jgi:hypothetical protein